MGAQSKQSAEGFVCLMFSLEQSECAFIFYFVENSLVTSSICTLVCFFRQL